MNKDLKKELWLSKPGNPPEDLIEKEVTVDDQIEYLVKQIEGFKEEVKTNILEMNHRMTNCHCLEDIAFNMQVELKDRHRDNMKELQSFMEKSKAGFVKWSHLFFGGIAATITYLALHYV